MQHPAMKILLAYDGSEHAKAALADLRRAGLPRATAALVFSVAEVTTPIPPLYTGGAVAVGQAIPIGHGAAALWAQQGVERLERDFPDWQVSAETAAGSPAWAVLQRADECGPDLLVVGSHGRSTLGRLIFGSVSQQLVQEAYCSVRVGRAPAHSKERPPRVLLCLDGSAYAEAALRAVAERAWPPGTAVRLLTVVSSFPEQAVGEFQLDLARAEAIQGAALLLLFDKDVQLTTAIKAGEPQRVVLEQAAEWGADSIFLGARGLNRWQRLWLGSVSATVVTRATCSVEIARVAAMQEAE